MKKYMAHTIGILKYEPISIFGWPLFLPVCIARNYYTIWTKERMRTIIDLAKAKNIAIEINEMAHVPHKELIIAQRHRALNLLSALMHGIPGQALLFMEEESQRNAA